MACLFKVLQAFVAQIGMPLVAIVPSLDPLKDILYYWPSGLVFNLMNQFLFQCSEETLHSRIAPAISFPTHTLNKLVVCHLFLENITRKLRTSVAVYQKPWLSFALTNRHCQCSGYNRCIKFVIKIPAYNPPRVQVHHDWHVKQSLFGWDVRDVGHPLQNCGLCREISGYKVLRVTCSVCVQRSLTMLTPNDIANPCNLLKLGNTLLTARYSRFIKVILCSPTNISTATHEMTLLDVHHKGYIAGFTRGWTTCNLCNETASAGFEQLT